MALLPGGEGACRGHPKRTKPGLMYDDEAENWVANRVALRVLKYGAPGPNRWKERSRTYTGLAEAMASQWG